MRVKKERRIELSELKTEKVHQKIRDNFRKEIICKFQKEIICKRKSVEKTR